jgi:alpha-galactosidase
MILFALQPAFFAMTPHDKGGAVANPCTTPLDTEGFPRASAWQTTPPFRFDTDWQGKNPDPERETEVRLLWAPETLFLKFRAGYREITVFSDANPNGRRDQLWNRDVVEVFLQTDVADPWVYKEIEIAPNGMWLDLAVNHRAISDLHSGLKRRVTVDRDEHVWTAEVAIPMAALAPGFDCDKPWRVNFFRVEGAAEPRFYSAWRPTHTLEPDFHVPKAFAPLVFSRISSQ